MTTEQAIQQVKSALKARRDKTCKPNISVLSYRNWLANGYQVRKGQKKLCNANGAVFCAHQVDKVSIEQSPAPKRKATKVSKPQIRLQNGLTWARIASALAKTEQEHGIEKANAIGAEIFGSLKS
jgi:hypothetical protein